VQRAMVRMAGMALFTNGDGQSQHIVATNASWPQDVRKYAG